VDLHAASQKRNAGEDLVSGFGPPEGLGHLVVRLNKAVDRLLEFVDRSVDTATDLLLGRQSEEALDPIDPGGQSRREVQMAARPLDGGHGTASVLNGEGGFRGIGIIHVAK